MEEKERYEFIDFEDGIELIDTENKKALDDADKIKDTLNQQSKRLKELEQENQQLKQQLHDLPKKIVGEIRDIAEDYWDFNICEECGNVPDLNALTTKDFEEILATILKKYGGEDDLR